MPTDEEVVQTAAQAAEGLVFSRFKRSAVRDYDVEVTFEDGVLEVDVWINAPEADADAEVVAEDATLAARSAVDDLFEEAGDEQ
jgi:ribosomal protein S3